MPVVYSMPFDFIGAADDIYPRSAGWFWEYNNVGVNFADNSENYDPATKPAIYGGSSLLIKGANSYVYVENPDEMTEASVKFWTKVATVPSGQHRLVSFWQAGTVRLEVLRNSSGNVRFEVNGSVVLDSSNSWPDETDWGKVSIGVKLGASGQIKITHVDGTETTYSGDLSAITGFDQIRISRCTNPFSAERWIDHFVLFDSIDDYKPEEAWYVTPARPYVTTDDADWATSDASPASNLHNMVDTYGSDYAVAGSALDGELQLGINAPSDIDSSLIDGWVQHVTLHGIADWTTSTSADFGHSNDTTYSLADPSADAAYFAIPLDLDAADIAGDITAEFDDPANLYVFIASYAWTSTSSQNGGQILQGSYVSYAPLQGSEWE